MNIEFFFKKVEVPFLNQTSTLELHVFWCGSKNKYHKDTCLKKIRLCAQNMITNLKSMVIVIGGWD